MAARPRTRRRPNPRHGDVPGSQHRSPALLTLAEDPAYRHRTPLPYRANALLDAHRDEPEARLPIPSSLTVEAVRDAAIEAKAPWAATQLPLELVRGVLTSAVAVMDQPGTFKPRPCTAVVTASTTKSILRCEVIDQPTPLGLVRPDPVAQRDAVDLQGRCDLRDGPLGGSPTTAFSGNSAEQWLLRLIRDHPFPEHYANDEGVHRTGSTPQGVIEARRALMGWASQPCLRPRPSAWTDRDGD